MPTEEKYVQLKESEILNIIDRHRALDATYKLIEVILQETDFHSMTQKIADTIPKALGYELGMIALIDRKKEELIKVAISQNVGGNTASKILEVPLEQIKIPFDYTKNISIRAIREKKQLFTDNLYDIFTPAISKSNAKLVQEMIGTRTTIITPLMDHEKPIGVFIVAMSKPQNLLSAFEKQMITKFAESVGVAVENARLFTDLKKAKESLHHAYENLKVLDKLKDEFISLASHELRTPMTIVKSYLWMLQTEKAGTITDPQRYYLDKAISGTERMIELINDMLDVTKMEKGKVEFYIKSLFIYDIAESVLSGFEIKATEKDIKLEIITKDTGLKVLADEQKLKEILVNLIGNAYKFTKKGSIKVFLEEEQEYVKVSVADTGIGISQKDIHKLFHKFGQSDTSYTVTAESGGTGLGLYIVKLFVERMGGKVGVLSEGLNKGCTFWFTLPKNGHHHFLKRPNTN